MITAKVGELKAAEGALTRIAQIKLPTKAAYHISKLMRLMHQKTGPTSEFEKDRTELVKEMGLPDNAGGFQVPADKMIEFQEKYAVLANNEVSIEWNAIPYESLADAKVAAIDLLELGPLLAEPVVETKGEKHE